MSSSIGMYDNRLSCYTGTRDHPDVLTLFVKSKGKIYAKNKLASTNWIGFAPVLSTFSGIARIICAARKIFSKIFKKQTPSQETGYWNDFKNIFRGLVEMIPFAGNLSLIIYDSIKLTVTINAKITNDLKQKDNTIGIAIDDKILFTVTLDQVDTFWSTTLGNYNPSTTTPEHKLALFHEFFSKILKKKQSKLSESLKKTQDVISQTN